MSDPLWDAKTISKRVYNHFEEIWRCADSGLWSEFKKSDLLSFLHLDAGTDYKALKRNQIYGGERSIWPFAQQLQKGDLIFVMSKKDFFGLGIVRNPYDYLGPKINLRGKDYPAIEIEYLFKTDTAMRFQFSTSPQPATFSKIEQYNFDLTRTINYLAQYLPEAIQNLVAYMDQEELHDQQAKKMKDFHVNTILYGPPGTGKTHQLNQLKVLFTDTLKQSDTQASLREQMKAYKYWEIIAAILYKASGPMLVKDICEHALYKARFNPTNKVKPQNMAWVDLQAYATDESTKSAAKYRRGLQLFEKDADSKWTIPADKRVEVKDILDEELFQLAEKPEEKTPDTPVFRERFEFITFHQKYSYEDFIEGIRPVLSDEQQEGESSELAFSLHKGVFYRACLEAIRLAGFDGFADAKRKGADERKKRFGEIAGKADKQYALFIDEINRANISAVFGELITLIEDSKRMGQKSELWVTLPVSGEEFCVPPNLYIVGTMNTADKSISLLDIALRRRFEFQGMYPEYSLENEPNPWWAAPLERLNNEIYNAKSKNPDFFIGHAFFLNKKPEEAATIYNLKIIPLLHEYFQNNTQKVESVLVSAGVKVRRGDIRENFQLIAE